MPGQHPAAQGLAYQGQEGRDPTAGPTNLSVQRGSSEAAFDLFC